MKFGILGNLDKPGLKEAVVLLTSRLDASGEDYLVDAGIANLLGDGARTRARSTAELVVGVDMLVAFGGDGTILSAARNVGAHGTPILGVNLGKLGFLAEFAPEEIPVALDDIIAGKYIVEERLVLEAECPAIPGRTLFALNDIVVDKSRSSRVISVETHIDGAFAVDYRGDGLIVSTPTGSTAYALSNGGPIVIPTANVIGITPISPHTLSGRPIVVPDTSLVRIIVHSESVEVLVSADGQEEAGLTPPVELTIRKAPYRVRLVKRRDRTYFELLRAKLLWGEDVRSV